MQDREIRFKLLVRNIDRPRRLLDRSKGRRTACPRARGVFVAGLRFEVSRRLVRIGSEGGAQDLGECGARVGDGVALHATGAECLFAQVGDVGLCEAVGSEARDGKIGGQGADPCHSVLRRGIVASGEESSGLAVAFANGGGSGCEIGFHDGSQQGGADGAVWGIEGPADGRSETVHGPKASVCESHSAEERAEGHVFACRRVVSVLDRSKQGATDSHEAFSAECVGERVRFARDKGFEDLGEGIESGCGRDQGRQGAGEVRIYDGDRGQHERASEADFYCVFR